MGVPMLLALETIVGNTRCDNLSQVLFSTLSDLGGMSVEQIMTKVRCFDADGATIF